MFCPSGFSQDQRSGLRGKYINKESRMNMEPERECNPFFQFCFICFYWSVPHSKSDVQHGQLFSAAFKERCWLFFLNDIWNKNPKYTVFVLNFELSLRFIIVSKFLVLYFFVKKVVNFANLYIWEPGIIYSYNVIVCNTALQKLSI